MTKAMQKMSMGRGKLLAAADLTRRPAGQVQDLYGQNRLIRRNGASGTLLRVAVTVACVMLLGCGSNPPPLMLGSSQPSDWMALFSDDTPISVLSIPGTHDTCTYTQGDLVGAGYVKTQERSIVDQLDNGIRFLDIRCRLIGNGFAIHHGPVFLGMTFQDVINDCKSFLQAHLTETILMDVGHEYEDQDSTLSFHQVFLNYYNANRYLDGNRDLWYLGTTIPTLGQVRGKIVLIRSFDLDPGATAIGIGMPGGQNSDYYSYQFSTNPDQTVYIENLWQPNICDWSVYVQKENAAGPNIQRAEYNNYFQAAKYMNHLYMTFLSANETPNPLSNNSSERCPCTARWPKCGYTPREFADELNPWFLGCVKKEGGPVGIVIMDFPGNDIIELIIDSSFWHPHPNPS